MSAIEVTAGKLTSSENGGSERPAASPCTCASLIPGSADRPSRSITVVPRPTRRRISWVEPVRQTRPRRTASAWATPPRRSSVCTSPLSSTRSAGRGRAAPLAAAGTESAATAPAPVPTNWRRVRRWTEDSVDTAVGSIRRCLTWSGRPEERRREAPHELGDLLVRVGELQHGEVGVVRPDDLHAHRPAGPPRSRPACR